MKRARKLKECEPQCSRCWLQGKQCHSGTLQGSCIACGKMSLMDEHILFEAFFNKDLDAHVLLLAQRPDYALLKSDDTIIEINITSPNALPDPCLRFTESELLYSIASLKPQIDQVAWQSYTPNIRCKTATTSLITSALFGRAYLTLLFPSNVTEEAGCFSARIHLFDLFLTRLDESVAEVVRGFNQDVQGDRRYWSEASSALAILHHGLLFTQKGLESHSIKPLCGDETLADVPLARIKSTVAYLNLLLRHKRIGCDLRWASILDGSLEEIKSNIEISCLTFRKVKKTISMSTRSFSSSSFGSTSIGTTNTPPSSNEASPPRDHRIIDSYALSWTELAVTGPRASSTPHTTVVAPWEDSSLSGEAAPSTTTTLKQVPGAQISMISYNNALAYDDTFKMSFSRPLPTNYALYFNGFSDVSSPESFPNWQTLGMFSNVPSEIEQDHSHVSLPWSHKYDLGEETSVMDLRDLSSELHNPHTFIG
ncbi:hypothetical protein N431DRAFT_564359 [Stipitochalara longipes BDJ]|nr:hypothetical protein N431DRAFT_564359 [Stipitochalara longipes BDJ]